MNDTHPALAVAELMQLGLKHVVVYGGGPHRDRILFIAAKGLFPREIQQVS